ncbi:putative RING finger domain protein [Aspergillus sclerotiicarbonarius CBS 121057]|uniref:Putative RING finger domain protein n=1 Tax=Aspergillus sclerotiicarbonarius (strain CBS 121057 / IBT 28362) TaxID=1448318 RepID=A0A319FKY2_ASPSB|nr:putative RING finger domain protein [Aspergillus sclerotiicarbonarius CBS 121057]
MAHSKRNTSLPHFTSYERDLLRSNWGTKRGVIGRDSFLPFGSCRLCLRPARAPVVACATNGDLFCRECAISDLLAQRQEIKRLEKERDEAKKRLADEEERALEEARTKELHDFELVSMGLEAAKKKGTQGDEMSRKRKAETTEALVAFKAREVEVDGKRKKVFELDEKEMAKMAREEQERLKDELKREKESNKSALPSFWVPSLTPTTDPNEIAANKAVKLTPICPASTDSNRHSYSLKSLVEVHFTEEKGSDGSMARVCPSCKKTLTNGLKAMLTKPCGHVICQPCVNKFMTPHDAPDPHASKEEQEQTAALHGRILCYVCETDVTPSSESKDSGSAKKKKKDKEGIRPGLVAVSSEGTGFAGRGGNVATKTGVAFQC